MKSLFPQSMLDSIERTGVIAVLVVDEVRHAVPLARALMEAGINAMELTLRTPAALEALQAIRREVPKMVAGVGTVLTGEQVDAIIDAGAAFGVAPGLNPAVVKRATERGLPFAPGIMTASDLEAAVELGCREMKFFPAEPAGGLAYLKSLRAPYAHLGVRFIPLGGIKPANLTGYLADPGVLALGGSWIAPRNLILAEDWAQIQANAREARTLIENLHKDSGK